MKQIVKVYPPVPCVTLNNVDCREIIGIVTNDPILKTNKYIMVHSNNAKVSFCNGNSTWDSDTDYESLMNRVLKDSRVNIFVFDNLWELADWING